MNDIFRSFGRALVSQLHPRMLLLTVLPFVLATLLWGGLLWWGWDPIMGATRSFLETSVLTSWIYSALDWFGLQSLRSVVAPLFGAHAEAGPKALHDLRTDLRKYAAAGGRLAAKSLQCEA